MTTIPTTNEGILRAMLDSGKTDEAMRWLDSVSTWLKPAELVVLQQMALKSKTKRKVGAAGHVRDDFAQLTRGHAFYRAVKQLVDEQAMSIEKAAEQVSAEGISDPGRNGARLYKSAATIRAHYRKWHTSSS